LKGLSQTPLIQSEIVPLPSSAPARRQEEVLQHDPLDVDAEVEDLVAIGGDALEQFYRELNDAAEQMDDDAVLPPASIVVAAPSPPQQSRIEQLRVRLASVLSGTLDFAGRNGTVVQPINNRTRFLRDEGSGVDVDKRAACAILSLHNSSRRTVSSATRPWIDRPRRRLPIHNSTACCCSRCARALSCAERERHQSPLAQPYRE